MSIAVSLLQKALGWQGGRIMVLMGGPPTVGPGMIVGRPLTEPIRSHTDLQKDKAPYHKAALAFYKVRHRLLYCTELSCLAELQVVVGVGGGGGGMC